VLGNESNGSREAFRGKITEHLQGFPPRENARRHGLDQEEPGARRKEQCRHMSGIGKHCPEKSTEHCGNQDRRGPWRDEDAYLKKEGGGIKGLSKSGLFYRPKHSGEKGFVKGRDGD